MKIDLQIPAKLVDANLKTRRQAVIELTKALGLTLVGQPQEFDLHKAAKGERITSPHLNPAIWELEKEFYALWDPKKIIQAILVSTGIAKRTFTLSKAKKADTIYRANGEPLTSKEMDRLEEILMTALHVDRAKVHKIIVQSAAAAKLAGGEIMGKPIKIDISKLPKDLREAILLLRLNPVEVNAIKFAYQYASMNIKGVTERARKQIKNIILEGLQTRTPRRQLATKLMREMAVAPNSVLNRDWERVAITEANRSASDGFIASQPEGGYVLGNSHDDACQYCNKLVNKKIYRVTHNPPPSLEGLDPKSKKYREIAERWENEIWVGKSNVGRGLSGRKIENHKLRDREHHERAMPVLPLHPHCRCRWSVWIPDLYYLKGGRVEFAVDDKTKAEQAEWLKGNPQLQIGQK